MYNAFGSYVTDGGNCVTRLLDKILKVVDVSDVPVYLLQSALSPFLQTFSMIDSSHSSGNSSLFQIELISLWTLQRIVLYLFNHIFWDLPIPGDLCPFRFSLVM